MPKFESHLAVLASRLHALLAMAPVRYSSLPRAIPERGIYLFSEGTAHLYVGRTNNIRRRLQGHCRRSGSHLTATFAFRVARQDTGMLRPTYRVEGARQQLAKDPVFAAAFEKAKARLQAMDIRFVEEVDPVRQALLEIYAAVELGTPFNDFDNH